MTKFTHLCRLCATSVGNTGDDIFSNNNIHMRRIKSYFKLELFKVEALSLMICESCAYELDSFDSFKERCIKSQKSIESLIGKKHFKIINEDKQPTPVTNKESTEGTKQCNGESRGAEPILTDSIRNTRPVLEPAIRSSPIATSQVVMKNGPTATADNDSPVIRQLVKVVKKELDTIEQSDHETDPADDELEEETDDGCNDTRIRVVKTEPPPELPVTIDLVKKVKKERLDIIEEFSRVSENVSDIVNENVELIVGSQMDGLIINAVNNRAERSVAADKSKAAEPKPPNIEQLDLNVTVDSYYDSVINNYNVAKNSPSTDPLAVDTELNARCVNSNFTQIENSTSTSSQTRSTNLVKSFFKENKQEICQTINDDIHSVREGNVLRKILGSETNKTINTLRFQARENTSTPLSQQRYVTYFSKGKNFNPVSNSVCSSSAIPPTYQNSNQKIIVIQHLETNQTLTVQHPGIDRVSNYNNAGNFVAHVKKTGNTDFNQDISHIQNGKKVVFPDLLETGGRVYQRVGYHPNNGAATVGVIPANSFTPKPSSKKTTGISNMAQWLSTYKQRSIGNTNTGTPSSPNPVSIQKRTTRHQANATTTSCLKGNEVHNTNTGTPIISGSLRKMKRKVKDYDYDPDYLPDDDDDPPETKEQKRPHYTVTEVSCQICDKTLMGVNALMIHMKSHNTR